MHYIPITTRILQPPQDDLFSVLDESLTDVQERDLILITSKVVGIHQGRCLLKAETDKATLVTQEAEYRLSTDLDSPYPITIKYAGLSIAAGIDGSNCGDYYSLLPTEPFKAAQELQQYLQAQHTVREVAVIITDSHVKPLRVGAIAGAIGWWGMHPVDSHTGKTDLFGNTLQVSATNIVDAVAAGAAAVCGEAAEQTPIVIVREVPNVCFTDTDTRNELLKSGTDDVYYPLLRPFYDG